MKITDIRSPGILANGIRLRTELVRAVSSCQIAAARTGGTNSSANTLDNCLADARAALASLKDVTAPAKTAISTSGDKKTVVITYAEGLDESVVPAASAFVFSPAKTISSVVVNDNTVTLTVTAALAAGATLAYTQPGTNQLRDKAGNYAVSFTATAVTGA